jgi:HSP20 family protein
MHDQMGRLLEASVADWPSSGVWIPAADIEETDDGWTIEAEVPGVDPKDVSVELRDRELVIQGTVAETKRKGILRRRGRKSGRFEYRVVLPGDVDDDNVEASLDGGVLRVRVAKASQGQPKRIVVKQK